MNNRLSNYTLLIYAGDNITNIKTYDTHTNALRDEIQLEYDNKKNPLYAVKENTGNALYASKNNVMRVKALVKNGHPVNEVIDYEFEYNSDDYPVKKSHMLTTGGKFLEQAYFYK